jgi:hypothetical protein
MKQRNGFVSNSSSSSYIVVVPDGFNPVSDDPNVHKVWEYVKQHGEMNDQYDYPPDIDDGGEAFGRLIDLLRRYSLEKISTGPDDGTNIILISNERIRENWSKQ